MPYFRSLPKIYYDLDGSGKINYNLITDITKRMTFFKDLKNKTEIYYQYAIKESDTPENIAERYYGSAEYFWIVLLFNDIIDPVFDWPLNSNDLYEYTVNKYGLSSINDVHHYEKLVESTDSNSGVTTEAVYIIDQATWANTGSSTVVVSTGDTSATISVTPRQITNYEYEQNRNEDKRLINILKVDYLATVVENLEKAYR